MIFGTYANPARFDGEAGFDEGIGFDGVASRRVGAMLAFKELPVHPHGVSIEKLQTIVTALESPPRTSFLNPDKIAADLFLTQLIR
jgi:hypothetical protein